MKRSSFEIYSLAVCFLGVIAIVISLSIAIYSVIEISFPEFAIDQWQYERHQSNEKFWQDNPNRFPPDANGKVNSKPLEKELTKMREDSYKMVLVSKQRSSTQTLVQSIIFFILSSVVSFFHWRLYKKEQLRI